MKLHKLIFFAALVAVFSVTTLKAQFGLYDVQLTLNSFNCDSSKVTYAVQVRSHDLFSAFNMGDANYRFSYDPRVVKTPKVVSQVNFSSVAPSSNVNYGPMTTTGSTEGVTRGVVSLNGFYIGLRGGATRVDTAWTTAALVSFSVVDLAQCATLTWHDETIFPSTNMNEVELNNDGSYNLYIVTAGGVYRNITSCFSTLCAAGTAPTVAAKELVTKQDSTATVCMTIVDPDAGSTFTTSVCG